MALRTSADSLDLSLGARARHRQGYEAELQKRDESLHALTATLGPESRSWQLAEEEKSGTQGEYEAIGGQLGRPIQALAGGSIVFWAFATVLAAIEAPVNVFVFDVALQTPSEVSYLVSFAFAMIMLIGAHISGRLTRQMWSQHERRLHISNIVLAVICMTLLLALIALLTIGRAQFTAGAVAAEAADIFSAVKEQVLQSGLFAALALAVKDTAALILGALNVSSILATFLLGFLSHDPDKNFDNAYLRFERAKSVLRAMDRKYKRRWTAIVRKSRGRLEQLEGKHTGANSAVVVEKKKRGEPPNHEDSFVLSSLDHLHAASRRRTAPASPHPSPESGAVTHFAKSR